MKIDFLSDNKQGFYDDDQNVSEYQILNLHCKDY
jgi:hypothetical protein